MIFRNPKFGNTYNIDTGVKIRRTLDGDLRQAYDPQWPLAESFTMSFEALSRIQVDAMIAFYSGAAGLTIQFTDHEGFLWNAIVKSEALTFTQRGRDCLWETDMEMIGSKAAV